MGRITVSSRHFAAYSGGGTTYTENVTVSVVATISKDQYQVCDANRIVNAVAVISFYNYTIRDNSDASTTIVSCTSSVSEWHDFGKLEDTVLNIVGVISRVDEAIFENPAAFVYVICDVDGVDIGSIEVMNTIVLVTVMRSDWMIVPYSWHGHVEIF